MNDQGLDFIKQLLLADYQKDQPIYIQVQQRIRQLVNNKKQLAIFHQLMLANLDAELKATSDKQIIVYNGIFFSSVFLTTFLFKRKVSKMIFLLGCSYINFYAIQPLQFEYQLRTAALQNTVLGQEVRNLYRFYFDGEEFTKPMTKQCEEYLKAQEIRKEIYKRRM